MTSKPWNPGWPRWRDSGRRVEIERDDGTIVGGKLIVTDTVMDGEGDEYDEYPIWGIEIGNTIEAFVPHKRWRFL